MKTKDHEFGPRLARLRERAGLTQRELEIRAKLPRYVVSQYENGFRTPGLVNLKLLVRGLGCSGDELLGI